MGRFQDRASNRLQHFVVVPGPGVPALVDADKMVSIMSLMRRRSCGVALFSNSNGAANTVLITVSRAMCGRRC